MIIRGWTRTLLPLVLGVLSAGVVAAEQRQVKIVRDDYGVPHIYADDLGALFFGFGRSVAEDRLFQLEMTRRSSWGTVSEALGADFVDLDVKQRQLGYTREQVKEQLSRLAPEYRTMLRAYADGVNDVIRHIEQGKAAMPPEFGKLGFKPALWSDEDLGRLFIAFMGTRYSDGHSAVEARDAAWLAGLTSKFGAEKGRMIFEDLIPKTPDPLQLETIPRGENWFKGIIPSDPRSGNQGGIIPPGIEQVAARMEAAELRQADDLRRLGVPLKLGSYGWVVGAGRTLNGSAILLGGPEMGLFSPSYLHEVGLHGAGFDVVGSTPIGHIAVLFGHNATSAWSATAGNGDIVDLFVEKLDPADPTRYQFKGEWRKLEAREELIKVKGAADVMKTFYRSVHGPIESVDQKNGVAYSRARGFANLELESMAGWVDKTRAQNFKAFLAAARRNALSITWLYADIDGTIGFAYCGRYPRRHPDQDPRLPTPGTGEREWLGFLPSSQVPQMKDPKRGFIVNWNNQPAVEWPHSEGIFTSRANRSKLIFDFFDRRPQITLEDVKESVRYAAKAHGCMQYFMPLLLNAVRVVAPNDPELKRPAELLEAWNGNWEDQNGDGKFDSPGATIFHQWYQDISASVFTDATVGPVKSQLLARTDQLFGPPQNAGVLLNILEGKHSAVLLKADYLGGVAPEQVMVNVLRKTVRELRRTKGIDPRRWLTPVENSSFNTNNYLGVTQSYNELRDYPPMRRGSENHIVVLGPQGVKGVSVVAPGISAIPPKIGAPSPHYQDQVDLLINFEYKKMRFQPEDVEFAARSVETLSYSPKEGR